MLIEKRFKNIYRGYRLWYWTAVKNDPFIPSHQFDGTVENNSRKLGPKSTWRKCNTFVKLTLLSLPLLVMMNFCVFPL